MSRRILTPDGGSGLINVVADVTTTTTAPAPVVATVTAPAGGGQAYAGVLTRFLAVLVDGLIIFLPLIFFGLILGTVTDSEGGVGFINMLGTPISWIYYVYFTGKTGQTPGKKVMKIKVIDAETGQPIGYGKAALREIIGKLVSAVIFLGYLWAIWDKRKQAWHDKIAGTVVVKA